MIDANNFKTREKWKNKKLAKLTLTELKQQL